MKKLLPVLIALSLLAPLGVSAHETGQSFQQDVGKYLIDVGYNSYPIAALDPVHFDFKIYQREPVASEAPYGDVWVRVFQGNKTFFAGGIAHMETGTTGMVYVFPKQGVYSVSVRYETADNTLGEGTFQVMVDPAEDAGNPWVWYAAFGVGGVCVGAAAIYIYVRKRKRHNA